MPTPDLPLVSTPAPMSVRQWLWLGVVQDRPAAIALLAGLVLLGFSVLLGAIWLGFMVTD
jgi:hypothetical protein